MHTLKGILLSLLTVSPIAVSLSVVSINSVNAQADTQTLAKCVNQLNEAYPYKTDSNVFKKHTQDCLTNLATQVPTESLGQCVAKMNDIYPYIVGSNVMNIHTETCNNLLRAQRSNSNRQVQPTSTPNGTIFVIPGASRQSPQEFANCVNAQLYKQRKVCIDRGGDVESDCYDQRRGVGGTRTVTEKTGLTIAQSRAICGG